MVLSKFVCVVQYNVQKMSPAKKMPQANLSQPICWYSNSAKGVLTPKRVFSLNSVPGLSTSKAKQNLFGIDCKVAVPVYFDQSSFGLGWFH